MKARITDFTHLYCEGEIDSCDFAFDGECFQAPNSLHSNKNIIFTKPNKGSGVVIFNKNDYIDKMHLILDDSSKFIELGLASSYDKSLYQKLFAQLDYKEPEYLVC